MRNSLGFLLGALLPAAATASAPEAVAFELRARLEAVRPADLEVTGEPIYATRELPRFYQERLYQPAWSGEPWLPLARDLVRALRESEREGLRPADYHLAELEALLARARPETATPQVLGDLDLLLTDAFLVYGAHLVSGRIDPETIDPDWAAARREVDLVEVLRQALADRRPREALRELLPADPAYGRLRDALVRYRALAAWPAIPAGAERIEDGDPRIPSLRDRLLASGDLAAAGAPPGTAATGDGALVLDEPLREAVKAFQRRHGLGDDGVVGAKTLRELNVPPRARARQIELNLERWRWLSRDLGRRHVLVDVPAFALRVVEDGRPALLMRVVVGRSYRRTPVMSAAIRYLVFNPYWEVPPRLAVEDKLPEIRKDPGYLAAQKIRVLEGWGSEEREIDPATVDWRQVHAGRFPYRLRQDPGPLNALGRVKFMFPNAFNVYLHDTPSRALFGRSERAASSGCIRVEKPLELAEYLLRGAPDWDLAAIRQAVDSLETRTVPLPEPVAVHLQYWTASVDEAGVVQFRQDVYERDAALAAALALPPPGDDA